MATIFVYNESTGSLERYTRGENDAMPYNTGRTLLVREFRGASCSPVLWTTRRAMRAFNQTRAAYGKPIYIGYAFKRIWEGGHGSQSQHYAGSAFDVGQNLSSNGRAQLRRTAERLGVWSYVEPAVLTPRWVHFDTRMAPPACTAGGYPLVRQGMRNNYVLVLQDALNALGYPTGGLDGIFGARTLESVRGFQRVSRLTVDGLVGCNTWRALVRDTVGIGQTSGVLWGC